MDKETLWILKKLSERKISVESADRILRALRLLNESEERAQKQNVTVETPQEAQETEEPESADEIHLLGDDGIAIIEDIPDGAELAVEKAGNITIQGWDESYLRIEGEKNSSTMRLAGNLMSIRCDSDITFYAPLSIRKISFAPGSGLVDIENCPDDMVINNDNRDINVRRARGNVKVSSNEGNIRFQDCHAHIDVSLGKGNVSVQGSVQNVNVEIENGNAELALDKLSSDGAGRISVNKGNITVKAPPDFKCELIARGSRENMYIELPVEVMEKDKNLLRGTLNGGGATLEILAPDGEIRLQIMELPDEQPSMADVGSNSEISQSSG